MNSEQKQKYLKEDALEQSRSDPFTKFYVIWNSTGDWGYVDMFPVEDKENSGSTWICYFLNGVEYSA